ncbi:MAG: NRAMP family divalent metal transporter, partial [Terriglobales bacterium]
MRWLKLWKTRLLIFFAVVGPGFITANVDNDAPGIYTYSVAGARFGYSLLWTIVPMIIALVVVQEMAARMGAVTGKGLSDLIREEFGLRTTFLLMLALVATNFGNVVAEFAGIASSLELFAIPRYLSVPVSAAVVWLVVVKGTYKSVEKVFLLAAFFYVAYIVAGVLARPDWFRALASTVPAPVRGSLGNSEYLYLVTAMIGATIAPWMQFYLQASVVEKGVTARQYGTARIDVIVGAIFAPIVAGFIVIACAAGLHAAGHYQIHDAADAAFALRPLAGRYA